MCLSTAYENEVNDNNLIMRNVMSISYENGFVVLTDLMERTTKIKGVIIKADLVENYVIINTNND